MVTLGTLNDLVLISCTTALHYVVLEKDVLQCLP